MAEKGWGTRRYGEIAVGENLLSPAQVDEAVGIQARSPGDPPIGEIFLALGILTDRDHLRILKLQQNAHNTAQRSLRRQLYDRQVEGMRWLAQLASGAPADPAASN